jgi:hypothetical protein
VTFQSLIVKRNRRACTCTTLLSPPCGHWPLAWRMAQCTGAVQAPTVAASRPPCRPQLWFQMLVSSCIGQRTVGRRTRWHPPGLRERRIGNDFENGGQVLSARTHAAGRAGQSPSWGGPQSTPSVCTEDWAGVLDLRMAAQQHNSTSRSERARETGLSTSCGRRQDSARRLRVLEFALGW